MNSIFLLMLFGGGFVGGLYASTVGSVSLISFPLVLLTGLPVHVAIATNRFASIMLELASAAKYYQEKKLNLKLGLRFGAIAAVGALIGSNVVVNVDEKYLNLATSLLLVLVFLFFVFRNNLGLEEKKWNPRHWLMPSVAIFLLGIYGGFFGAGFGTFISTILILLGFDFLKSAAMSRVVGLMMSVAATVVFAYNGLIHYPYAIVLGMGMAIGGWTGAGIGIEKGNRYIRSLFILVVLLTSAKLVWTGVAATK